MVDTHSPFPRSPLETLVRKSSRRAQHPGPPSTKPTSSGGSDSQSPISPLLHTRFRSSTSTTTTNDIGLDSPSNISGSHDANWTRDSQSVYSSSMQSFPSYPYDLRYSSFTIEPQAPASPTSSSPTITLPNDRQSLASQKSDRDRDSTSTIRYTWQSNADPFAFKKYESPQTQVPKVVITSPTTSPKTSYHELPPARYTDSLIGGSSSATLKQRSINFSRPIRPSVTYDDAGDGGRHRIRTPPPVSSSLGYQQHNEVYPDNPEQYPSDYHQKGPSSVAVGSHRQLASELRPVESNTSVDYNSIGTNGAAFYSAGSPQDVHTSSRTGDDPGLPINVSSPGGHVRLLTSPPSPRPASHVSIYSTYSFYQLEDGSRTPSPTSGTFSQTSRTSSPTSSITASQDSSHIPSLTPPSVPPSVRFSIPTKGPSSAPFNLQSRRTQSLPRNTIPPLVPPDDSRTTPEEYLALGIQHHEANSLTESATCFERAATVDGGCGAGMLMWGLSLRHAWGTPQNEKAAFRWLRRAAESAMEDLEAPQESTNKKAVRKELVLAIYEVGQCFFHGWGVPQDKKMAVSYFQTAARLGDSDAQQELGYCLANGKGCKKNLKEAAKWYRAAAAQGASTIGLTWIYKPKYS